MMNGTNLRDETQCSSVFSVGGDWGVAMVSTTVTKRAEQRGTSLEELYARHAPAAVRLSFLMTSDRELSRDIAQDAFIRVAGRFRQLRFPDMFDAYLRKTVVNLCLSHFRHERVERDYLAGRSAETEPVVESPDLGTRDELRRALQRLPVRQRTAIERRDLDRVVRNHRLAGHLADVVTIGLAVAGRAFPQERDRRRVGATERRGRPRS